MEFKCTWFRAAILFIGQIIIFFIPALFLCSVFVAFLKEFAKGQFPIAYVIFFILVLLGIASVFGFHAYCSVKHLLWDRKTVLLINEKLEFVYTHGCNTISFSGEDVKEWRYGGHIDTWPVPGDFRKGFSLWGWGNGNISVALGYIRLTLTDGTVIYLTRYLGRSIDCICETYKDLYMPKPNLDFGPLRQALFTNFIPKGE